MKVIVVGILGIVLGYSLANPKPVQDIYNKVKEEIYERH
jgi:hypothetical protein